MCALALVLVSCATLGPNARVVERDSGSATVLPDGVSAAPFLIRPLSGAPVSADGAIVEPPAASRSRPRPADESCAGLTDPGYTSRCGITRAAPDGDALIWLAQLRTEGRGVRVEVFRASAAAARLDVVLEAFDEEGLRFDDVRGSVADVNGDGTDEIALSFYRRGAQQVLAVDLVQWPGQVAIHREYVQGSARAAAGALEGWEAVGGSLVHERITFADGAWQQKVTSTGAVTAVHGQDFADPFVLRAANRYYGYSTNRGASNVPVVTSTDLRTWYSLPDALPRLPAWSTRGRVWAPSVLARPGGYVLFYTTREAASGLQCLSRGFSASPGGPFVDDSTGPLVCQQGVGGSIDPSPFADRDGTPHLLWKSEGWGNGEAARLWSQPLSPDGLNLVGSPADLLAQDRAWEAPTIEGPAMVRDGERLYLFYSAGRWQNTTYAVGWASCESVAGPCTKADGDAPLMASALDRTGAGGPGGTELVVDGTGQRWLAYHAWVPYEGGYPAGRRMLHVTPLRFEDGVPVLGADRPGP